MKKRAYNEREISDIDEKMDLKLLDNPNANKMRRYRDREAKY